MGQYLLIILVRRGVNVRILIERFLENRFKKIGPELLGKMWFCLAASCKNILSPERNSVGVTRQRKTAHDSAEHRKA